jgi:hypothetical protein
MKTSIRSLVTALLSLVLVMSTVLVAVPTQPVYASSTCWCTGVTAAIKGLPGNFPDANAWKNTYLTNNGYQQTTQPVVGDIVTFDWNHVGVIDSIADKGDSWKFNLLQNIGNPKNNSPETAKNGDDVKDHKYWAAGNCSNVGIVMYGKKTKNDAGIQYWHKGTPTNIPVVVPAEVKKPTQFLGNPSSTLRDNNGSADLKVCADNIVGQTIYVVFSRPGREWAYNKKATSRCVTFTNMDGSGPLNGNTLYVSRAALNQQPLATWSQTSCYAGNSNQQGLCDTVRKNNK